MNSGIPVCLLLADFLILGHHTLRQDPGRLITVHVIQTALLRGYMGKIPADHPRLFHAARLCDSVYTVYRVPLGIRADHGMLYVAVCLIRNLWLRYRILISSI